MGNNKKVDYLKHVVIGEEFPKQTDALLGATVIDKKFADRKNIEFALSARDTLKILKQLAPTILNHKSHQLEIFLRVSIEGEKVTEVAKALEITRQAVSQSNTESQKKIRKFYTIQLAKLERARYRLNRSRLKLVS
jgi:hypothetical protein